MSGLWALALGCSSPPAPDVILVTLDTTRADALGAYGGPATPTLDALAASGTRFDAALSPTPLTQPAHATLLTGLEPWAHGVRRNGERALDEQHTTLAELLAAQGYATAASIGAFVTRSEWGFGQGYGTLFQDLTPEPGGNPWHLERAADDVVAQAVTWLDGVPTETPAHVWVHLYDAHAPYQDSYAAEVQRMDAAVGTLVAAQARRNRPVLWVIAGDHGESLGEHAESTHGLFVYQSTQRVPLILSGAGVPVGVHTDVVPLSQVLPRVLGVLGLRAWAEPAAAPVLLESWSLADRYGWAPHRALVDQGFKLVATPTPELYDLGSDPDEQRDLAQHDPERVAAMLSVFDGLAPGVPDTPQVQDAATRAQLAALGYLLPEPLARVDGDDPKDHADTLALLEQAAEAEHAGDLDRAADVLTQVVDAEPTLRDPWLRLLRLRPEPLLAERAATACPDAPNVLLLAGTVLGQAGHHDRTLELSAQALALRPDSLAAAQLHVTALDLSGQSDQALVEAQALLTQHPDEPALHGIVGLLLVSQGRGTEAIVHLERALQSPHPPQGVRVYATRAALHADQVDTARQLIDAELADYPASVEARSLAMAVCMLQGDTAAAAAHQAQLP